MTPEQLCKLACAAIDDDTACAILGDALLEANWYDARVQDVLNGRVSWMANHGIVPLCREDARAIAAVMLFGSWTRTMWPVVARCVVPAWYLATAPHVAPFAVWDRAVDNANQAMVPYLIYRAEPDDER